MTYWKDLLGKDTVVIFSKSYCPYCTEASVIFEILEVGFKKIEVDKEWNEEEEGKLKAETKQNTFPNIWIGDQHIGGCSDLKGKVEDESLLVLLDNLGISYSK